MQISDIIWRNYWNTSRHIDQAPGGLLGVMKSRMGWWGWGLRGVLLYRQYTPNTTCTRWFLNIETPVSMLSMVDIGERVCLYVFMHVSMRLRSSMILSSTCAVAGWWRAGGGAGRGWWLQRGRAGQQEPATTTRHSLPHSLSLSRSLCPTACEKMKCSGRMSSWFNRCHKKFLLSQGKVKNLLLKFW